VAPFNAFFIRAPIVERLLPQKEAEQTEEEMKEDTVIAPSKIPETEAAKKLLGAKVEILGLLPGRGEKVLTGNPTIVDSEAGDIIAVRQGNVFGTSFHPELTGDARIHSWWLNEVKKAVALRRVDGSQS
jgi:pyridoxal 5'-phosphate synthase pdxT subunit